MVKAICRIQGSDPRRRHRRWRATTLATGGLMMLTAPTVSAGYTLNQAVAKLKSKGLSCSKPVRFTEDEDAGVARRTTSCRTRGIDVTLAELASVRRRREVEDESCTRVFSTGRVYGHVADIVPELGITEARSNAAIERVGRLLGLRTHGTKHSDSGCTP
jgi:hypothetical protein